MTLPNQRSIELPLLLELERAGGRVMPREPFYTCVASHFPEITAADRALTRESTGGNLWENLVDWARSKLRQNGELDGGETGIWEITDAGRQRLRHDLAQLGLSQIEVMEFIRSTLTIPQKVGERWQPRPLRQRSRVTQQPVSRPVSLPARPFVSTPPPPPPPPSDTREGLLAKVRGLSPTQFEHLVGRFLEAMGLKEMRVTARSHDGGIDGECVMPFLDVKIAFRAKRWANAVGPGPVGEFKGRIGRYERGIFITTSSFTPGATETAELPGVKLVLVDGQELANKMMELGLGVKTIPVTKTEIDNAFFQELGG